MVCVPIFLSRVSRFAMPLPGNKDRNYTCQVSGLYSNTNDLGNQGQIRMVGRRFETHGEPWGEPGHQLFDEIINYEIQMQRNV